MLRDNASQGQGALNSFGQRIFSKLTPIIPLIAYEVNIETFLVNNVQVTKDVLIHPWSIINLFLYYEPLLANPSQTIFLSA